MSGNQIGYKGLEGRILRTLEASDVELTPKELATSFKIGIAKVRAALYNLARDGKVFYADGPEVGSNDPITLVHMDDRGEDKLDEERRLGRRFNKQEEQYPYSCEDVPTTRKRPGRKPIMPMELREYTKAELDAMTNEEKAALKRAKRQAWRRAHRAHKAAQ